MSLTWKQCQLIKRLAEGERVKEAASKLNMSSPAALYHLHRARIEMGAKTNYQLCVMFAASPTHRQKR